MCLLLVHERPFSCINDVDVYIPSSVNTHVFITSCCVYVNIVTITTCVEHSTNFVNFSCEYYKLHFNVLTLFLRCFYDIETEYIAS